jgi:Na+/proline symporter
MAGGLNGLYAYEPPGGWLPGGWELLGTGALQGLTAYPFMDPVLTDRTFLSTPRTMAASFFVGGLVSMTFIVLFSSIGLYGTVLAAEANNGSPVVVADHLGEPAHSLIVLVMMTSSLSTLDSTFTSMGKLFALDVAGWLKLKGDHRAARGPLSPTDTEHVGDRHVLVARFSMVALGVAGCLYLLASSDVLSATTVSGTVVMGLAPPVFLCLFWRHNSAPGVADGWRRSPLAFIAPFVCGIVFGFAYQQGVEVFPHIGVGGYARLLGVNVYGTLVCFGACAVGFAVDQLVLPCVLPAGWLAPVDPEPCREDAKTGEMVARAGWAAAGAAPSKAQPDVAVVSQA